MLDAVFNPVISFFFFPSTSSLDRHMQTHHGHHKPFRCKLCSFKSSYNSRLKTHVLKAHAGELLFAVHSFSEFEIQQSLILKREILSRLLHTHENKLSLKSSCIQFYLNLIKIKEWPKGKIILSSMSPMSQSIHSTSMYPLTDFCYSNGLCFFFLREISKLQRLSNGSARIGTSTKSNFQLK